MAKRRGIFHRRNKPWQNKGKNILDGLGNAIGAALPSCTTGWLKLFLGTTLGLYILNQKHMLPKPISAVVSKTLFWPTLPITVGRRIGQWTTEVDDTVLIGGAPFGFAGIPEQLKKKYGVRGVINMCEEYRGPLESYHRLGMNQLWLPTVDHFEPSVAHLKRAVMFIRKYQENGERVYVHCRAGHGRSAAVVLAWLMDNDPTADVHKLNDYLCSLRNVRSTLWKQKNIRQYHRYLRMAPSLHVSLDPDS